MKLLYFKDPVHSNFGDELNSWMWPRLLPDILDENDNQVFLGIGSIIGKKKPDLSTYKPQQKKIIFGSGFSANYHQKPNLKDNSWDVFFVRGPRTAKALGLSPDLALGDAAILIRAVHEQRKRSDQGTNNLNVAFMPHWESMIRGQWKEVCEEAGIILIDPRDPVDEILEAILQSKYLITEAMHGAIVADALRVPWIATIPINPSHREKWLDWAEALKIDLKSYPIRPSTLSEMRALVKRRGILDIILYAVNKTPLSMIANAHLRREAAKSLKVAATQPPHLSEDKEIEAVTEKMQQKLRELVLAYGNDNLQDNPI